VSKSYGRRLALAIAALVGAPFFVGCADQSVNPPLVKPEGVSAVTPEQVKAQSTPPTRKSQMPRGSAGIKRDPSGVNRENQ
jgi:hypothetical protein